MNKQQKIVLAYAYRVFTSWLFVTSALLGCASDPGKTRMEDPFTVGFSLLQYRPAPWIGLGLETSGKTEAMSVHGDVSTNAGQDVNASKADFKKREQYAYIIFYPWTTSRFFLGLQSSYGATYQTFTAPNQDGSGTAKVNEREDFVTVGPALGWTFIGWLGLTAHVDIGPRFVIKNKRTYTLGADGSGVDEKRRDQISQEINASSLGQGGKMKFLHLAIGISF